MLIIVGIVRANRSASLFQLNQQIGFLAMPSSIGVSLVDALPVTHVIVGVLGVDPVFVVQLLSKRIDAVLLLPQASLAITRNYIRVDALLSENGACVQLAVWFVGVLGAWLVLSGVCHFDELLGQAHRVSVVFLHVDHELRDVLFTRHVIAI